MFYLIIDALFIVITLEMNAVNILSLVVQAFVIIVSFFLTMYQFTVGFFLRESAPLAPFFSTK